MDKVGETVHKVLRGKRLTVGVLLMVCGGNGRGKMVQLPNKYQTLTKTRT
ncbi:hypothetical protein vBEcoMphAPEC6_gp221c [Escherichia phage vB_EcoM_phAPEC6]|nr:hypothetical protein vBEcoMphAPEC6_gp221c [Escherichia phage vB_EcoM_phAPEC6]